MKRIAFIAPVESIRGNMSGTQDLRYALNNNKAYESPRGQRNYARNYRPSFIGARRAADGLCYFAVKTKSAVHMTAKAVKAMALQGATGAIFAAMLAAKSETPYQNLVALHLAMTKAGETSDTLRKFASDIIRAALVAKSQNIAKSYGVVSFSIKNPYYSGEQTTGATISEKVLVEFWPELNPVGISFTVAGAKGIAESGDDFSHLSNVPQQNVLDLEIAEVSGTNYVKKGKQFLTLNGVHVLGDDAIVDGAAYDLTDVAPQA